MNGAVESGERAAHAVLDSLDVVHSPFDVDEPRRSEWEVSNPNLSTSVGSVAEAVQQALMPSPRTVQLLIAVTVIATTGFAWWVQRFM